jgi:hypothetical protein
MKATQILGIIGRKIFGLHDPIEITGIHVGRLAPKSFKI